MNDFLAIDAAGITTIDCFYAGRERSAAAYLLVQDGEGVFIDNNTAHALPRLLAAARARGLAPEQIRAAIITHAHLDHAGGSGALMQACPNATLIAHPRAARHMIDPSRLSASAKQVYGAERFARLYGELAPIASARVRSVEEGETFTFGKGRTLTFWHTRGHANHHICIWDEQTRSIFTGDSFGLCFPVLQSKGIFVMATTSPTDFDPQAARESAERIAASNARAAYPTHFGPFEQLAQAKQQLCADLDFSEGLMLGAMAQFALGLSEAEVLDDCHKRLQDWLHLRLQRQGLADFDDGEILKADTRINAQGIVYQAQRRTLGNTSN